MLSAGYDALGVDAEGSKPADRGVGPGTRVDPGGIGSNSGGLTAVSALFEGQDAVEDLSVELWKDLGDGLLLFHERSIRQGRCIGE
jgi:hypothetical protein